MAGRRQTLRPVFVQNREIQLFYSEIFVQFAYRHFPITMLYYNQDKGREVIKMIKIKALMAINMDADSFCEYLRDRGITKI